MLNDKEVRRLQEILAEIRRRGVGLPDFKDTNFPKQLDVLSDNARAQAWQCTRRAGKSTTWAKKNLSRLVNSPGGKGLFLALTLDSAKGILWDIIEQELDSRKLKHKPYKQEGRFELWNGASLKFFGVDATYREMKRILGQKYVDIGIDEAGSMTIDMETLILQNIWPALSDLSGSITLLGTPENIPNTFFQKVTEGKEKSLSWSIHKWTAYDNPYMARQWTETIAEFMKNDPTVVNTSWFKTHYLNQWCSDDDLLIIQLGQHNLVDKLPERKAGWFYTMGVDLGFNDASAFVVFAHHPDERHVYMVLATKAKGMDLTDVAMQIKSLQQRFPIYKIVVDGANKQGVEELKKRHSLPLTVADKTDKASHLRIMGDDFKQGVIKLITDDTEDYRNEVAQLQWKKGTQEEDPRCENHLNDSALYATRYIFSNRTITRETEWNPEKEMLERFKKEGQRAMEQEKERRFLY